MCDGTGEQDCPDCDGIGLLYEATEAVPKAAATARKRGRAPLEDTATGQVTMPGESGRPDNSYCDIGPRRCLANGPRGTRASGYVCYAKRGHAGEHVGWSGPGMASIDAHWPNDDSVARELEALRVRLAGKTGEGTCARSAVRHPRTDTCRDWRPV